MSSLRHKTAIAYITHDAHRLTKREREALGLPAEPVRKVREVPAFPDKPGEFVWFALKTMPQREADAVQALSDAGFVAFNPTERVKVRASRRRKFKRSERERAILTSMVLVGFRGRWVKRAINDRMVERLHADVPWLNVLTLGCIRGFVGMGSGPVPVPLANVRALGMACGRLVGPRTCNASIGDQVEITFGAFEGQSGQVVELVNGEAKVMLFGGTGLLAKLTKPLTIPEGWVRPKQVVLS